VVSESYLETSFELTEVLCKSVRYGMISTH